MPERVTVITVLHPEAGGVRVSTKKRARDVAKAIEEAAESKRALWLTNLQGHEACIAWGSLGHIAVIEEVDALSPEEQEAIRKAQQRNQSALALPSGIALAGRTP